MLKWFGIAILGLIAFAGNAAVLSPLTIDQDYFRETLDGASSESVTRGGSRIGDALRFALGSGFDDVRRGSKDLILLTDGDNNLGRIDPLPAAQLAAAVGVKIYAIGIGIEQPCNMPRFDPTTGQFILDANGNIIPSLLLQPADYTVLGKMAAVSGGQFYRATNQHELQSIYNQIDHLEKSEVKLRRYATYHPLFQWPLLAALGLLAVELILSNTRYRRVP